MAAQNRFSGSGAQPLRLAVIQSFIQSSVLSLGLLNFPGCKVVVGRVSNVKKLQRALNNLPQTFVPVLVGWQPRVSYDMIQLS